MNWSSQKIVNSYDNSITYMDEFLAEAIGVLSRQSRADTVLLYVSDHGESLEEGGALPARCALFRGTRIPNQSADDHVGV